MITNIESITWYTKDFKQGVLKDISENGIVDLDIFEFEDLVLFTENFANRNQ